MPNPKVPTEPDLPEKSGPIFHTEPIVLPSVTRAAAAGEQPEADDAAEDAAEDAPIHIVISTETPCDAWNGTEVLSHAPSAIDLSMVKRGLSLYVDHGGYPQRMFPDPAMHIGIVENIVRKNSQLEGDMRFSKHPLAQQYRQNVLDGTMPYVSVRAFPIKRKVIEPAQVADGTRQVIWTRWRPEEVSIVGIPADRNATVTRAAAGQQFDVETEYETATPVSTDSPATTQQEEPPMPEPKKSETPDPAAAAAGAASTVRSAGGAAVIDRDETTRIIELCNSHGVPERASDFVRRGLSPSDVGLEILEGKKAKGGASSARAQIPASAEELGFSKTQLKRYSVSRALLQMAELKAGKRQEYEGFEGEMHQELEKNLPQSATRHGGILIPLRLEREGAEMEGRRSVTRALGSNVSGGGAELTVDRMMEPVELLTNRALVAQFGAQIYTGLANNLQIPRETSDVNVNWMRENPSSGAAQSQPGYGFVTATAKTLIGSVPIPQQLLRLASIDVHNRVNFRLMNKHGLVMDRGSLHGRGTDGEPTGLFATPGVQTIACGGPADFGKLVDMESAIADVNADAETMAYMTTPKFAGKLKKTLDYGAVAGARPVWTGKLRDGEVNGYKAGATKQVSGTLSGLVDGAGAEQGLIYGDWSQIAFCFWGAFEATTDQVTLLEYGQIKVVTFQMFDSVILRPEAFIVATGNTLA